MMRQLKPPATLESWRVLEYAILNNSVQYSGHSNLFRGDREVGPVPCLVIAEAAEGIEWFLFHCDAEWTVLGIEGHNSVAAAKASAAEVYRGVTPLWTNAQVTKEDAAAHLDALYGEQRCNFCGKTPLEYKNPRFIEKNGSWICDSCVKACYELLQENDESREIGESRGN